MKSSTYSFRRVRIFSHIWQKRLTFSCICSKVKYVTFKRNIFLVSELIIRTKSLNLSGLLRIMTSVPDSTDEVLKEGYMSKRIKKMATILGYLIRCKVSRNLIKVLSILLKKLSCCTTDCCKKSRKMNK